MDFTNGTIEKYKPHLIAEGHSKIQGLDYNETFAQLPNL